jgi:hypothetical protein
MARPPRATGQQLASTKRAKSGAIRQISRPIFDEFPGFPNCRQDLASMNVFVI